jgi:hypothetical protein
LLAEVLRLPLLTDDGKFASTPATTPRHITIPTDAAMTS